ncbi:MAG TPA: hypothetical protein VGI39_40305 [Polyangiaceae bacterium]|jgi:hypothetical protein
MSPRFVRPITTAFALLTIGAALCASAPAAQGADDRAACVASYERSQVLRREHKLRRAREELRACSRVACPALVRNDCINWLGQMESTFPSLIIRAEKDGGDVANVKVVEDNEVVATRLDGSPLELEPGEHAFRFETEGAPPVNMTVVAREGEHGRPLTVTFTSPKAAEPVAGSEPQGASRPIPAGVFVLGGLGLVGLGTFAALGASGQSDENGLRGSCSPNCNQGEIDRVRGKYIGADVALGVGAAALVSAAVWYFVRPSHTERQEPPKDGVAVAPNRGGAVVQWTGTF